MTDDKPLRAVRQILSRNIAEERISMWSAKDEKRRPRSPVRLRGKDHEVNIFERVRAEEAKKKAQFISKFDSWRPDKFFELQGLDKPYNPLPVAVLLEPAQRRVVSCEKRFRSASSSSSAPRKTVSLVPAKKSISLVPAKKPSPSPSPSPSPEKRKKRDRSSSVASSARSKKSRSPKRKKEKKKKEEARKKEKKKRKKERRDKEVRKVKEKEEQRKVSLNEDMERKRKDLVRLTLKSRKDIAETCFVDDELLGGARKVKRRCPQCTRPCDTDGACPKRCKT